MRVLRTSAPGGLALVLEPQTAAHAVALYPVLCDPRIYLHENGPPPSLPWLLQRFTALEARSSPDGRQQWLNWVVHVEALARPATGPLTERVASPWAGYVQATIDGSGDALLGYEFTSAWWGRGVASAAVAAMLAELADAHGARRAVAVTKRSNLRSQKLLRRLAFAAVAEAVPLAGPAAADECCWLRPLCDP